MPEAAEKSWYWRQGAERLGPISFEELVSLIATREILPNTLVWTPGQLEWRKAAVVPGLFSPPDPLSADKIESAHALDSSKAFHAVALPTVQEGAQNLDSVGIDSEPTFMPREAIHSRRNYFGRHWRGELSLAVSYWVNGFLATAVTLAVVYTGTATLPRDSSPEAGLLLMCGIWLAAVAIYVWLCVGIWRSANSARYVWAALARLAVIVGCVNFASEFSKSGYPVILGLAQAATGDKTQPANTIRALRNGTELELAGYIRFGLAAELEAALKTAPNVRTIHLTSLGGRIYAARQVAAVVRAHRLATYVPSECTSACTEIFVAGRERWISPQAKLGFHRSALAPGLEAPEENATAQRLLIQSGITPDFARHAYATANNTVWYPTIEQLKEGLVITGVAGPERFAMSGRRDATSQTVDDQLLEIDVYRAIQGAAPEAYTQIREEWLRGLQGALSEAEVTERTRTQVQAVSMRLRQFAPDDAIAGFFALAVKEYKTIQARDPAICDAYAAGTFKGDIRRYLTPEEAEEDRRIGAILLSRAAQNPQRLVDEKTFDRLLADVGTRLKAMKVDPQFVWSTIANPAAHPRQVCPAAIVLFQAMLAMPSPSGPDIMRYYFKQD